mgnify:CR=1 FL=1
MVAISQMVSKGTVSMEELRGQLGERLRGFAFARVFTSPLQRARKTCELAGFGVAAVEAGGRRGRCAGCGRGRR